MQSLLDHMVDIAKNNAAQEYAASTAEWKEKLLLSSRRADAAEADAAKWREFGKRCEANLAALQQSVSDLAASF